MRALPLLLLLVACKTDEDRSPAAPQNLTPVVKLEAGTQQDLAKELDAAETKGTWSEVRKRWQGQTLRWTVTRQASLCRSADSCFVAAFPVQRPAKRGWLPQLMFAPGQYALLEEMCGDKPQCEVTVEGYLEKLEVSAEMPTNLKFNHVKLLTRTASR